MIEKTTRCKPCYQKYKNSPQLRCQDCYKTITNINKITDNNNHCKDSYLNHKKFGDDKFRKCKICQMKDISPDKPSYINICVKCYINSKK